MFETGPAVDITELKIECPYFPNYLLHDHNTRFHHLLSSILLAVTAIFYAYVEAESQNVATQHCIFHLVVTLCVVHLQIFLCVDDKASSINFHFDYGIVIFGLASFLWSSMLAHQLWKNFRKYGTSNETFGFKSRLLLGNGIPAMFVISALGPPSLDETGEKMFCGIIVPLIITFAIAFQMVNMFFFIDLLRKALRRILWYSCEKSWNSKEPIYGFLIFLMLFYNLALPWLIIMGCEFFSYVTETEKSVKIISLALDLFSEEGIFLSFTLIAYHKYASKYSVAKEEKSRENVVYERVA